MKIITDRSQIEGKVRDKVIAVCENCKQQFNTTIGNLKKSEKILCRGCKISEVKQNTPVEILQEQSRKKSEGQKRSHELHGNEILEKRRKTNELRYGTTAPQGCKEIQEKIKKTKTERFGEDYNKVIVEKSRDTMQQKYGKRFAMQVEQFREKSKETCKERFGVEYSFQSEIMKTKGRKTLLEKYGVVNPGLSPDIQTKIRQTCLSRYGTESFSQTAEFRKKSYHRYLYDNLSFDSGPELVFYIYHKDRGIPIQKEPLCFEYLYEGVVCKYFPDFLVDDVFVEIKGDQFVKVDGTWQNPFDHTQDEKYELKHQCALKNNVRILYSADYQKYIDYVNNTYTADFLKLFKLDLPFPYPEVCNKNSFESLIRYFHKSIYEASKKGKLSPLQAWQDKNLVLKSALNRLQYTGRCTPSDVLQGFSVAKIAPKVSVFKPNLAETLCKKYLNEFSEVFDPFSGFSGRLLGVSSCGKKYIGQDINEKHVKESNEIIQLLNLTNCTVEQQDVLTDEQKTYECLFTCPPYGDKEFWTTGCSEIIKSCDEWIDVCLEKYKCKRYLFVVDETEKYKDCIVDTIENRSHFGKNTELIIMIDR